MAGLYTQVAVVAPSSARAGVKVNVQARITNLYSQSLSLNPSGQAGSTPLWFGKAPKVAAPGETLSWYDSFVMPSEPVTLLVYSWYLKADGEWSPDDSVEKVISPKAVAPAGCLPQVIPLMAILAALVVLLSRLL